MKKTVNKLIGWLIVIFGCILVYLTYIELESVVLGLLSVMVIIIGTVKIQGASDEDYNETVSGIQRISDTHGVTFEKMYQDLKDVETPLGKPWVYRAAWNVKQSLVYGPGPDGDLLYIYLKRGKCYISGIGMADLSSAKEERKKHEIKLDEASLGKNGIVCFHLMHRLFVKQAWQMMDQYFKTGIIQWPVSIENQNKIKAYAFDEKFRLTGQDFELKDMDGRKILMVKGSAPLKSFHFYNPDTKEEVFTVTKRIMHVMPHYDFYENGNLIGSFEQKLNICKDVFELKTDMGTFTMKQNMDTIGTNYTVSLDGVIIGAVAEKLNLSFNNLVFNNYVMWTIEDRYTNIMAAFTVMAVREWARDNTSNFD